MNLKCDFCGKYQSEVKRIIAGPGVYICDECVDICKDIIEEDKLKNKKLPEVLTPEQEIDKLNDRLKEASELIKKYKVENQQLKDKYE